MVAEGKKEKTVITPEAREYFLRACDLHSRRRNGEGRSRYRYRLAWTSVGGEILYVETTTMKGKGSIILTGQFGDVMKESAQAALGLIRSRAKEYSLDEDMFQNIDIHVHFPQGAIPKDGPSAGITMASAIMSKLTGIPVRKDVAMTGEITLTGRVLPIGGLKEKALAAMRHGIKTIVIPDKNKKDLDDIPEEYRAVMTFIPVKTFDDVLDVVLTEKVTLKRERVLQSAERQGASAKDDKNQKSGRPRKNGNAPGLRSSCIARRIKLTTEWFLDTLSINCGSI